MVGRNIRCVVTVEVFGLWVRKFGICFFVHGPAVECGKHISHKI